MDDIKLDIKQEALTTTTDQDRFAVALKTWRLRANKTQQQVADEWGVSRFSIIKAENAQKLSWPMAYKLFANLADVLRKEGIYEVKL